MSAPKPPEPKSERARNLFSVKGWPSWYAWVQRLALHRGCNSVAALVELALANEARRSGFAEPPPPRWWMSPLEKKSKKSADGS
jgi:hypothetical protein